VEKEKKTHSTQRECEGYIIFHKQEAAKATSATTFGHNRRDACKNELLLVSERHLIRKQDRRT
jgi:hypothetical protein